MFQLEQAFKKYQVTEAECEMYIACEASQVHRLDENGPLAKIVNEILRYEVEQPALSDACFSWLGKLEILYFSDTTIDKKPLKLRASGNFDANFPSYHTFYQSHFCAFLAKYYFRWRSNFINLDHECELEEVREGASVPPPNKKFRFCRAKRNLTKLPCGQPQFLHNYNFINLITTYKCKQTKSVTKS